MMLMIKLCLAQEVHFLAHIVAEGFDAGVLGEGTPCKTPCSEFFTRVGHTARTQTLVVEISVKVNQIEISEGRQFQDVL